MARAAKTQSTEVRVYKDDGAWWAEIDDPEHGTRCTYSAGAGGFLDKVESMAMYVDVDADSIDWAPRDDASKKFLNRARKARENGAESEQDVAAVEDEESVSDTEPTASETAAAEDVPDNG